VSTITVNTMTRLTMLLLVTALFGPQVAAQEFPASTIKIVVPSAPGATTDALARMIADQIQKKWGQPVIVENRAGAAGNIGAEYVVKANPDGYTLLFSYPAPLVVNKSLYARLPFDPDGFVPVSLVSTAPLVLAVNPKTAANSVQELIAYAKANPHRLNYASQGTGTTGHLAAELFKSMAGVDIVHVPYKSSAPAQTDLLSGQVDMMLVELSSVLQHILAGRLRALAVGSAAENTTCDSEQAFGCGCRGHPPARCGETDARPDARSDRQHCGRNGGVPESGARALGRGASRGQRKDGINGAFERAGSLRVSRFEP